MDRYCPECNSTMTPSLVGYLCSSCGHMQRFYSAEESAMSLPRPPTTSMQNTEHIKDTTGQHTKPKKHHKEPKNKVRATLKRLMLPELTSPHTHLIGDGDDNIKPVLSDKIEDEQQMPTMVAENMVLEEKPPSERHELTPQEHQKKDTDKIVAAPSQSSNLSEFQSALHPQKNTSVWVMLGLASLMLIFAAAVLFLIILS